MSIADYEPPKIEFELAKGVNIILRGLSTEDIVHLFEANFPEIQATWELYEQANRAIFTDTAQIKFLSALISKCPGLVSELISRSAGEPEHAAKVAKWGLGLQMGCLQAIFNLTLQEAGGLKNLSASLDPMLPTLAKFSASVLLGSLNRENAERLLSRNKPH